LWYQIWSAFRARSQLTEVLPKNDAGREHLAVDDGQWHSSGMSEAEMLGMGISPIKHGDLTMKNWIGRPSNIPAFEALETWILAWT
jgi:hypothetical protein